MEKIMSNITWLDLYNFLYKKAHDLHNLGNFNWSANIKVVNPETGEEYEVEPRLANNGNYNLFCNPTLVLKISPKNGDEL